MISVLLVDDKPDRYNQLIESIDGETLNKGQITVVNNVRDALEQMRQRSFTILVVDMLLPEAPWKPASETGGANLLEHILQDSDYKPPRYIIGITASVDLVPEVERIFNENPWVLLRTSGGNNPWEKTLRNLIEQAGRSEREQDSVAYGEDVCIITALRSPEFDAVMSAGFGLQSPNQIDSANFSYKGSIISQGKHLSVVAACCSRMGSVESALLSFKLINKYRPRMLIMAGICAGLEGKVTYGDAIVASPVWDYTSGKISADEQGNRVITYSPDNIAVDNEIIARMDLLKQDKAFFQKLHDQWMGEKPARTPPELHVGPSATGPAVIADENILKEIREKQNRSTIGLEMEAYGVYCAARIASRPRPIFFSLKSVCDYASFLKEDKYQSYAAYTSAGIIHEFLSRFGSDLTQGLA